MYKKEFDTVIRNATIPKAITLYGVCEYQIKIYEEIILSSWGKDGIIKFYFDEYDFKAAKSHLNQASLFGDCNILVIKTDKMIQKKELEELVKLCEKSDINYFLFIYFGDDSKIKSLVSPFGKNFVRFFKPNQNEALFFLQNEAKKIGLNINGFALMHLYHLHNENLSLSVNELQKLSLLNKEISVTDIDSLVYGMGEINVDDFIVKLLEKQNIVNQFKALNEEGSIDGVGLINALQNYLYTLYMFHSYIKINGNFDALKILGYPLPPQLAKQRAEQSIKIKPITYKKLFDILINAEYELKKNSHMDKDGFVISTILELQKAL